MNSISLMEMDISIYMLPVVISCFVRMFLLHFLICAIVTYEVVAFHH